MSIVSPALCITSVPALSLNMGRTCDQGYHVYVLVWNSAMNIPNKRLQDNNQKCCPSIWWGLNNKSNDKLAGAWAVGVRGEHLLSLYINELTLSWREGIKTVAITLQVITLFVKPIQSLIVWPTRYSLCHTILCIPQRQFDSLGEVFVLQDAFCNRITGRRVGRDRVTVYTCQTTLPPPVQCQGQGSCIWLTIRTFDDHLVW